MVNNVSKTTSNIERFLACRKDTEALCVGLETEDFSVQPVPYVSPLKWHLGHTTWFFEYFVLKELKSNFKPYHEKYAYLFNSYYQSAGERVERNRRGCMTRPTLKEIMDYRLAITEDVVDIMMGVNRDAEVWKILELGIHHEQQHQELFIYDAKFILGYQVLKPAWNLSVEEPFILTSGQRHSCAGGVFEIGHEGSGFCYDNELSRHKQYIAPFDIQKELVTNGEYMEFVEEGGYNHFEFWHAEAWDWIKRENITTPLYWKKEGRDWKLFTLKGIQSLDLDKPVSHVSYYEAFAFAEWKKMRLPSEYEWEVAADNIQWGQLWEWTDSAYLPYPGYTHPPGALGEYNGKFMVNQKVLRGASFVTPQDHSRKTYRNFYHPDMRWQFAGFRLVDK